ncbi:MAG: DUF2723 domain-containing protein [Elusimicrobiota bacterium]
MPAAASLFLGLFGFYIWSAYPALSPYRDSGDLASASLTLGIAHPPGYPLYVLASRAFSELLPLGSAAYRLHVFSALCGALACALLAWGLLLSRESSARQKPEGVCDRPEGACACAVPALFAALILGLSPCFRHLSVVSEMYGLNALIAAVLAVLAIFGTAVGTRAFYAAALLFGLGLGNHQTLLAALPLLWVIGRPAVRTRAYWMLGAAFLLLGTAVYLYLPLRARLDPVLDWGDPRTPRNLWRVLTRADYGGVRLHPERPLGLFALSGWKDGLFLSARLFVSELGASGAALLLWGCALGFYSRRKAALLAAFLLSGPLFIVWANLDPAKPETYAILEPHLILPFVFAALLAGLAVQDIARRIGSSSGLRIRILRALACIVLLGGWFFPRGAQPWSHRRDFTAWDFGKGLLASLPPGSVLVDPDDPTAFTLEYLLRAHGAREDVVPLLYFRTRWGYEQFKRRHPELLPARDMASGQEFFSSVLDAALRQGRPLYADLPPKAPPGWSTFPDGLAYRLLPASLSPAAAREALKASLSRYSLLRMHPFPPKEDFFSRHAAAYWPSALNNLGIEAQRLSEPGTAADIYRRALSIGPWLSESWNNLGNVEMGLGRYGPAEGCYRASLREKDSPQVGYNLGRVLLLAGNFDQAEAELKRAALAGVPDAANDLGLLFLRQGRTQEASRQWLEVVGRWPRYSLAYYNLALAFEKLGDKDRALRALEAYQGLVEDPAQKAEAGDWMRRLGK